MALEAQQNRLSRYSEFKVSFKPDSDPHPANADSPRKANEDVGSNPTEGIEDFAVQGATELRSSTSPSEVEVDDEQSRFREACKGIIDGRYQVLRELGRGGMGVVLLVRDLQLDCLRAVKRPKQNSARVREGFNHEGIAAAAFSHPNICQVHHSGEDDYGPFLVMEFVDGEDVKTLVDSGRSYTPSEAFDLALGILHGLQRLHEHTPQIIHRDIKPANILVAKDGTPKLTDFGLAKIGDTRGLSITGRPIGTPAYAAPEQWSDSTQADVRSDIYSFGRTLHYALTGGYPEQETQIQVPEVLKGFVDHCVSHDPERRFESVRRALEALAVLEARVRSVSSSPAASLEAGECPKCGASNGQTRRFCWDCATPLIEECAHCHWENRSYMRYCGNCQVDLDGWKEMLNLLREASACCVEANYGEAEELLVKAHKHSSQHPDFEPLEASVRQTINQLKEQRERIAALCASQRFEEAGDCLKQLLEAAPDDRTAAAALTALPGQIRERDLHQALDGLQRAIAQEDLEGIGYLLEKAESLAESNDDPRLAAIRAERDGIRHRHGLAALEMLDKTLLEGEWQGCRRALRMLQEAQASEASLTEQRLRYHAVQALHALEVDRAQELINELVRLGTAAEQPWLETLLAELHTAQRTDLKDLRQALGENSSAEELAAISQDLLVVSEEFGPEFDDEIAELKNICQRKQRWARIRRVAGPLALAVLITCAAGYWQLRQASIHAASDYLGDWIQWIDAKEQATATSAPPAPDRPWFVERLPAFIADSLANQEFDRLVTELDEQHWQHLGWQRAREYWDMLAGRSSLQEAREAFKRWDTRRLQSALPPPSVVVNGSTGRLQLPGELSLPTIYLGSRVLNADEPLGGQAGFDVSEFNGKGKKRYSIRFTGVSDVRVKGEFTMLVDLDAPRGRLQILRRNPQQASHIPLQVVFSPRDSDEQIKQLRYRLKRADSGEPGPLRQLEWGGPETPMAMNVPIPQPFETIEILWEAEDMAGNVFSDGPPLRIPSGEEQQAIASIDGTDLDSLRRSESLLLAGENGLRAAQGSVEIRRAQKKLLQRLDAYRPHIQLQAAFLRPVGDLPQTVSASFTGGADPDATNIEDGGQYLIPQEPFILTTNAKDLVVDEIHVHKRLNREWVSVWERSSSASSQGIPLTEHFGPDGEALELRVGTAYLRADAWIRFSVRRDSHAPEVNGVRLSPLTKAVPGEIAEPRAPVVLTRTQLQSPQGILLAPGKYRLELLFAADEHLRVLDWRSNADMDSNASAPEGVRVINLGTNAQPGSQTVTAYLADLAGNRASWTQTFSSRDLTPQLLSTVLVQNGGQSIPKQLRFHRGLQRARGYRARKAVRSRASGRRMSARSAGPRVHQEMIVARSPAMTQLLPLGETVFAPGETVRLNLGFGTLPHSLVLLVGTSRLTPTTINEGDFVFEFQLPPDRSPSQELLIEATEQNPFALNAPRIHRFSLAFPTR